jgi:small conductance mechanosensitive channel
LPLLTLRKVGGLPSPAPASGAGHGLRLTLALILLGAWPASVASATALLPEAAQQAEPQAPPRAIETRSDTMDDAEIATRIRSIFSQIPALRDVEVVASEGVVKLSGAVPETEDRDRAEAIAARVAGVVTVENKLTRDYAIDASLAPALGNIGSVARNVLMGLPLLAVAMLVAAIIGLFGYLLARQKRLWHAVTPNIFLADLLATSVRFLFILIGLVAALEIMSATALLGAVLGGAGVIGIALGFAVRDTVDNYVSSIMLSLRQPFRANDHVVIEGSEGRVIRLTSRATILMTLDGNHLRIPNSTVFKAVILNYSRNPERRFEFVLGIDADNDPVEGMAVGLAALAQLGFVLKSPKPDAIISEVGDSNIVLCFFGWVDQTRTDFLKGRSLAIQSAKHALEAAGFALPEPIYRLRFDPAAVPSIPNASDAAPSGQPATLRPLRKSAAAQDTEPEKHVERLVSEERAAGSSQDLLDPRRPVE